ncbi:hypothetical protein CIK05_13410 [Bdellovibrio sp. qaytius]|nr:hypothetical protein CIK05_13410 [Bdellovibrio sp. qaytius]
MALTNIQKIVQKLSEQKNVKKVIAEVQTVTHDLQTKIQRLSADQAVKKYKDLAKKVVAAENDLQKEVSKVVAQVKRSATDVEKNLASYKKKAVAQRAKIEKAIKAKASEYGVKTKKAAKSPKAKPAAKAKPSARKAKKKTSARKKS